MYGERANVAAREKTRADHVAVGGECQPLAANLQVSSVVLASQLGALEMLTENIRQQLLRKPASSPMCQQHPVGALN